MYGGASYAFDCCPFLLKIIFHEVWVPLFFQSACDIFEKNIYIFLRILQLFLKSGKDKALGNVLGGKGSAWYEWDSSKLHRVT